MNHLVVVFSGLWRLKRHPVSCLIRAADRARCVHSGESRRERRSSFTNKDVLAAEVKEELVAHQVEVLKMPNL